MNKSVLLYDSECALCTRFKKALEYLDTDGILEYKSIYDQSVYMNYPELNEDECKEVVHLIDPSGKIHTGGDVVIYLTKIFPGVSKFSWLLESDSAKKASSAFYKKINEMRIMKKSNCYTCGNKFKKSSK